MRRYETIIIIDPDLKPEGRDQIYERIRALIDEYKGFLVEIDEWGSRKLSYEIKKKPRGYYVRFDYCSGKDLVDELERQCRISDAYLKYMTVVLDKEVDLDAIKAELARKQAEIEAEEAAAREAAEKAAAAAAAAQAAEEAAKKSEKPAPQTEEDADETDKAAAKASDTEAVAAEDAPNPESDAQKEE